VSERDTTARKKHPAKVLFAASFCLLVPLGAWLFMFLPIHHVPPSALASESNPIDAELDRFQWRGHPIHPGVIYQLNTALSDSHPLIASVDLEGACDSQRFADPPESENGFLSYKNAAELGAGYFDYRHLGRSSDGKHVLLTACSGGGSGDFEDILIVKFSHDSLNDDGRLRDRIRMTLVGHFTLGDRDDGKVEVRDDNLFIGKSRYRDTDKVISLTKDVPN
jgi:hypothetical protein